MSKVYNIDMLKAEVFGTYLDENFYNKEGNDFSIVRSTSLAEQKKGIDLRLSSKMLNLKNVKVDEKCAIDYINNEKLKTFSIELSKIKGEGWFLCDHYETEYYLLAWPYGNKDFNKHIEELFSSKEHSISINDFIKLCREKGELPYSEITGAEIMLVSKIAIIDGLAEILQLDRQGVWDFLKKQSLEMRGTDYRKEKSSPSDVTLKDGIRIKKSFCWWNGPCHSNDAKYECRKWEACQGKNKNIKETEPINLLIDKTHLANWAIYKAVIGHQASGEQISATWQTLNDAKKTRKARPKRRPYLELYNEGLSIREIAKYNRVKMATVHNHLLKNLAEGLIDRKRLMGEYRFKMSEKRFTQIKEYILDKDLSRLSPLVNDAPFKIEYWEMGLVRASIIAEKSQLVNNNI